MGFRASMHMAYKRKSTIFERLCVIGDEAITIGMATKNNFLTQLMASQLT
jgi:deoxyxylulose-5-phosphate synthase